MTKKSLGNDLFVWFKVSLKDVTDVNFFNVAEAIPVSYRRKEKGIEVQMYWFVCALIVEIVFAFLRLYRDVSMTVLGIGEDR